MLKKKFGLGILVVILIVSTISFSSAGIIDDVLGFFGFGASNEIPQVSLGTLNQLSSGQEWQVAKATGNEANFKVIFADQKDKKTDICFILRDGVNPLGVDLTDKILLDSNNQPILNDKSKTITLKYETAKCNDSGVMKNGYHILLTDAQAINVDDYIKLGENSLVLVYQDINRIEYDLEFTSINITLFKNISGTYENQVNEIFITDNAPENYKFGANDTSQEGVGSYKYKVESLVPIFKNRIQDEIYYVYDSDPKYIHEFDFKDICSRGFEPYNASDEFFGNYTAYNKTADCQFNNSKEIIGYTEDEEFNMTIPIYKHILEVTFNSDSNIDPTITLDEAEIYSVMLGGRAETTFAHLETSPTSPYDSLVGYWNFDADDNTTAWDFTGENNDGSYEGNAYSGGSSPYGDALVLDGAGDYIDLPSNTGDYTDNFTIVSWFKTTQSGGRPAISRRVNLGVIQYDIYISPDGNISFYDGVVSISTTVVNDGNWHMGVWMINGSNSKIYSDGVVALNFSADITGDAGQANIGSFSNGGNGNFDGSIDEVMIFNTALNSSQILDIYNNQSLRFQSPDNIYLKQFNQTLTNENQVNVTLNTQSNLDSSIQAGIGQWDISLGYNNTDMNATANGLVSYWHFDEDYWDGTSGEVIDVMGLNNGTAVADANSSAAGRYGKAGAFDGNGDYVDLGDDPDFDFERTDNFTVSAWIKSDSQTAQMIYSKMEGSGNYQGFLFGIYWGGEVGDRGKLIFNLRNSYLDTNLLQTCSTNIVNDGNWHYVVATYNGTSNIFGVSLFIDGQRETLTSTTDSLSLTTVTSSPANIGGRNSEGSWPFNGAIDEVMIYNRSLSADEVKELYIKGRANFNYTDFKPYEDEVNFTISNQSTNFINVFNLSAGGYSFYSPIISGNVTNNFYNISEGGAPADTTAPYFTTIPNNATLTYREQLGVLFIGTDETALDSYSVNDTDFIINSTGWLSNNSILAVGQYELNISINDSSGNTNSTAYRITVNQNTEDCGVFWNTTSPVTYGEILNVQTNCTSAYTLYLNGSAVTNNSEQNLGGGLWNLSVFRTDDTNYSNIYHEELMLVNQATPSLTLSSNESWAITNGTLTEISGTGCPSQLTCLLYNDSGVISNPFTDTFDIVGSYNFWYNTTGNTNYTTSEETNTLVVSGPSTPRVTTTTSCFGLLEVGISDESLGKIGLNLNYNRKC